MRRLVLLAGCVLVIAALAAALASGAVPRPPSLRSPAPPRLPTANYLLQLQMQRYLLTTNPLVPAKPALRGLPVPAPAKSARALRGPAVPSGETCFVGLGSCSLTPCVELIGTPGRPAQLNSPASAGPCFKPHRPNISLAARRSTNQLSLISASSRTVVMNPRTGAVISITGPPATVVMNPKTGAVISITPGKR